MQPDAPPPAPAYFSGPNRRLAYLRTEGRTPGIVWLGGFRGSMTGTKATHLAAWAERTGRAFLRFDYTGHGASDGALEDFAISDWAADARAMFEAMTTGPQILVGSSMGAWIATLLALARPKRIAGLVFVAPAPDFTEDFFLSELSEAERTVLMAEGRLERPSPYSPEPDVYTSRMVEDGRENRVLPRARDVACPVRILHGMRDAVVPWTNAVRFAEALGSEDLTVTFSGGGDHQLSSPEDLRRLVAAIEDLCK